MDGHRPDPRDPAALELDLFHPHPRRLRGRLLQLHLVRESWTADAFEAFKETSLFDRKTAASFRKNILDKLGTEDAMTLYKRFRGREPKVEPLLKKRGLL